LFVTDDKFKAVSITLLEVDFTDEDKDIIIEQIEKLNKHQTIIEEEPVVDAYQFDRSNPDTWAF